MRIRAVVLKKVNGPVHLRETREAPFGNRILYGEILHPQPGPAEFTVEYQVTRKEYSKGNYENLVKASQGPAAAPKYLARFLEPDRLVPIDGKMKELADENTRGKQGTVERAHALYDYVFQTVRYDKSGTGWGRGDSLWVCDAKHGNCTDFHSLFISLARAEGIPARFEIGFPVPSRNGRNHSRLSLLGRVFRERRGVGARGYFRGLERPSKTRLFFWDLGRQPGTVLRRPRLDAPAETGRRPPELFYLPLRGSGREAIRRD